MDGGDLLLKADGDVLRGTFLGGARRPAIRVKKLVPWAKIPAYMSADAAGMDVCAAWDVKVPAGTRSVIHTGLAFELPPGWELQVRPRSGLAAKQGVTILNAPGTLDADYRGELCVILVNHGDGTFWANQGDRVAQLVLAPVYKLPIEEVEELGQTDRGAGGFGSTGA